MTLSIDYRYADCRDKLKFMQSVVMLTVVMLNVVAPNHKHRKNRLLMYYVYATNMEY